MTSFSDFFNLPLRAKTWTVPDADGPFRFEVKETFSITGRGTVLAGLIRYGTLPPTGTLLELTHCGCVVRLRSAGIELMCPIDGSVDRLGLLVRGVRPFEPSPDDHVTAAG